MLELQQVNLKWQTENVKLFQDNQKLARSLQESERSKVLASSDDQRIKVIYTLEEQVRRLTEDKANLLKQNEMYRQLQSDYNMLTNLYAAAVKEIDHFRMRLRGSTTNHRNIPRQSMNIQAGSFPAAQNGHNSQLYQMQSQVQHGQWPIQISHPHQATSAPTSFNGGVTASAGPRKISDSMVQSVDQNKLIPMFQQTSINTIDQTYPQPSSTLVHSQAFVNISGNTYSRSSSRASLQPPLTINTSLENRQNLPTPMSGNLPQHRTFSSASANATLPGHLSPTPATGAFIETRASSQEHPKDPISRSPLPNSTSVELSEDRSIGTPASLLKNDQPINNPLAIPTPSFGSPSKSGPDPLKRTSVDMSGDVTDGEAQQRKKPRLDSQENSTEQVEGQVAVSGTDMEVSDITRNEADEEGVEESDEEVIEIGPDGLRMEDDCVAALIEEVGVNGDLKACKLCNARFEMGFTTERPELFVEATNQELIEHCSTEHHDAWQQLRSSV